MGVVIAIIVLVRGKKLGGLPMEDWFGSQTDVVLSAMALALIAAIVGLLRWRATRKLTG